MVFYFILKTEIIKFPLKSFFYYYYYHVRLCTIHFFCVFKIYFRKTYGSCLAGSSMRRLDAINWCLRGHSVEEPATYLLQNYTEVLLFHGINVLGNRTSQVILLRWKCIKVLIVILGNRSFHRLSARSIQRIKTYDYLITINDFVIFEGFDC